MRVQDVLAHEPPLTRPAFELVEDMFARADEILAREEYSGIAEAPSFHTKLAGVTFEGRQDTLERVSASTPLRLVRQPDNPFDANACALFDPHGDQVGFLNRRLAAALAPSIDAGVDYDVEVTGHRRRRRALARRQRACLSPRRHRVRCRARRCEPAGVPSFPA
jgi:single-stranded-DNA-specific exonuclease